VGLWRESVGRYAGVSDDLRGTSRDSETLNGSASALPKWRYVVHGCHPLPAARHKTWRSANFVSAETAGGDGIGTLTVG